MRTIVSVGYGGRPPCALTGRGATLSTSAANDAKSMCDSISASGSPSASIFLRWCSSANRSVLMALRGFIGAGCGVQGVVILPKAGEAEVFRGALSNEGDEGASRPDGSQRNYLRYKSCFCAGAGTHRAVANWSCRMLNILIHAPLKDPSYIGNCPWGRATALSLELPPQLVKRPFERPTACARERKHSQRHPQIARTFRGYREAAIVL